MKKNFPIRFSKMFLVFTILIVVLSTSNTEGASLLKLRRCLEFMVDSTPIPTKKVDRPTSVAVGAILFFRRDKIWGGTSFGRFDFYPELFKSVIVSSKNRRKSTYLEWIAKFDTRGGIEQLSVILLLSDKQKSDLNLVAKNCLNECAKIIKSFTDEPIKTSAQDLWEDGRRKVNAILTDEQKSKLDEKIAEWKKKYDK